MRTPEQDAQRNEIILMALQSPDGRFALSYAVLNSMYESLTEEYRPYFNEYMKQSNVIEYVGNRLHGILLLNINAINAIDTLQVILTNEYLLYGRFYSDVQRIFSTMSANHTMQPDGTISNSL